MALPDREDTYIDTLSGPMELPAPPPRPTQMPINPTERSWRARQGVGGLSGRAMDVLQTTRDSASRAYNQARRCATEGYSRLSQRTTELSRQTRHVARYAQQNYPVRVLGVIAASAFVVGIGIRVWRSRNS